MRVVIPPTGNEVIGMLKTTSLVIAVPLTADLYSKSEQIAAVLYRPIPLLLVASTWYLAITSVLMVGQHFLEKRYSRGIPECSPPSSCRRWRSPSPRQCRRREPADMPMWVPSRSHLDSALMVYARNVRKSFGALKVLKGITLQVKPREVMCLVGPSGSGKSTFLRCINHLERVDGGRLYVDGDLIGYEQRAGKLHEMCIRRRPPPSGVTSGWSSSGSTCSRT